MTRKNEIPDAGEERLELKVAIVGGGKAARYFLDLVQQNPFQSLSLRVLGLCDVNPDAEGFRRAMELGITTTTDFRDLFRIQDLDALVELTDDREVLLQLIRQRPSGIGVLDHNILRLFASFFSVAQRLKSKEHEVRQEKTVSEFLMQQADARIVVLNPDFTIVDASSGYLSAYNRSKEEVIGKHCYEITHGFSSPCSEWESDMGCPLVETLKSGQSSHVIHEHIVDEQMRIYCDLETYPVKNLRGEVVRVLEVCRDVTKDLSSRFDMKIQEMMTHMGKLVQEDRLISLGKLAASCAHEINNPIHGILTFAHLMASILDERDPTPEDLTQFKGHLSLMCNELERCGNIVSGLLSFSRESGMETQEVELNEIIRGVLTLTQHRMELQNITLETDLCQESLPVRGDVHQLQQCLLNLVFNAIEAMPQGGLFHVSSRLDRSRMLAQITVRDSGSGIAQNDLSNIFDPFFTTKPEGEGTGLGLSIVYGIVKEHEGHIEVQSRVGEGTRFTLAFPCI
ncbi:MAG: PAS domain-containing protein [Deltaproteobacteria bacterium]|nr:PAS domain-containing protein [Deltaproteobacteria bacterium]